MLDKYNKVLTIVLSEQGCERSLPRIDLSAHMYLTLIKCDFN